MEDFTNLCVDVSDAQCEQEDSTDFLNGRDGLSTGHDSSEDITLHGHTEREGNNIKKKEICSVGRCGLARKDTSLNSGTVGDSLIGVDALLEFLSVEAVAEELLNSRNTGRTTNKHNLVNLILSNVGILEHLLNGLESAVKGFGVQVLETSTGDVGVEVLAIEQRVNLDSGLCGVGKSSLGTLASSPKTTESTGIPG